MAVLRRVRVVAQTRPFTDAPVAGGVDDGRAPALRRLLVAGLGVGLRVHPADDVAHRAQVQRVVLVEAELQMVRVEAGVDELHVLGRRVVVGDVPGGAVDGVVLRERIVRSLAAPVGVPRAPDLVGHPDAPLGVHHRVVRIAGVVPDQLVAVVEGRVRHLPGDVRPEVAFAGRVPHRQRDLVRLAAVRVHPDQLVAGELDAVDRTAGVDPGIALVARDLVVDVAGLAAPLPHREHHVALASLRPLRLRRHFARHDAVGPLGVGRNRALAPETVDGGGHVGCPLARDDAVRPGRLGRVEVRRVRDLARRQVAELVAELAALLEQVDPMGLRPHGRRDAVAVRAGARELRRVGHLHQRVPVVGRVDGGGLPRIGGDHCGQIERLPGTARHPRRIRETVAAHPDLVVRVGQVRQHVAPLVIRHHDLAQAGGEVVRLGDDPHPRLGAVRARNDAPDVVGVEAVGLPRGDGAAIENQAGRGEGDGCENRRESTGWS